MRSGCAVTARIKVADLLSPSHRPARCAAGDRCAVGRGEQLPDWPWLQGIDWLPVRGRAWLAHNESQRARVVLAPLLTAARNQWWLPTLATATMLNGPAAAWRRMSRSVSSSAFTPCNAPTRARSSASSASADLAAHALLRTRRRVVMNR